MEDRELLQQFVREHSQTAFGQLVSRHADWIYSTCRRRLGDPALAEDATQAVFLALLQKAKPLSLQRSLGPWLHRAAQFAAANIDRERKRRTQREWEVASMNASNDCSPSPDRWSCIESDLEPALDRLKAADRETIVLRFYQKKTHAEIASVLQISEEAGQKRLGRALERLRELLGKGDGTESALSSSALAALLAAHAVSPAPPAMAQSLLSLSPLAASSHQATLATAILRSIFMSKLKASLIAGGILCLLGVSALLTVQQLPPAHPLMAANTSAPASLPHDSSKSAAPAPDSPDAWDTIQTYAYMRAQSNLSTLPYPTVLPIVPASSPLPLTIGNPQIFREQAGAAGDYLIDLDAGMPRLATSGSAGHIKLASSNPDTAEATRSFAVAAEPFLGKRIRISMWFKSMDIDNHARLRLGVWGDGNNLLTEGSTAYANAIHGTTDWRQYQIVADIPQKAVTIMCTIALAGPGELWADGLQIEVVPATIPTTDDQQWHVYSPRRALYDAALDPTPLPNGHSAMLIVANAPLPDGTFCIYTRVERDLEKFRGKQIRLTFSMKLQNANGGAGPTVWVRRGDQEIIGRSSATPRPAGTRDWRTYSAIAQVPQDAQYIEYGLVNNSGGKVWLDVDSIECQAIDEDK